MTWTLLLAMLATWRLARLITVDLITLRLRTAAERLNPWLGYLVSCSWCISIWLAPLLVVPAIVWPHSDVVLAVSACLTASGLAGLLVTVEDRLDSDNASS